MAPSSKEVANVEQFSSQAVRQQFADMALLLPAAPAVEDAADRIVAQILAATTWTELDKPWSGEQAEALCDVPLRISAAYAMPSDFKDGLGVYLRVEALRVDTGEIISFSVGSVNIVAQLVRAHVSGWLPLFATIRKSERASSNGYFPMHLEITDSAAAAS